MGAKICIICGDNKDLESFYKHPKMADGRLGKCKDCCKKQAKLREEKLRLNPEWVLKEQERHREKYERLNYKDKQLEWDKNKPWTRNSIYKGLHRNLNIPKDYSIHHWCYQETFLKDVFIMKYSEHKKAHKFLDFDFDSFQFKTDLGVLLTTKEEHMKYLISKNIKL